jgi:hypothetical protein
MEHPEGAVVFQHACKIGLEGIVSKRSRTRSNGSRRTAAETDFVPAPAPQAKRPRAFLYAFDLLELNGDDLRREPIEVGSRLAPRRTTGRASSKLVPPPEFDHLYTGGRPGVRRQGDCCSHRCSPAHESREQGVRFNARPRHRHYRCRNCPHLRAPCCSHKPPSAILTGGASFVASMGLGWSEIAAKNTPSN